MLALDGEVDVDMDYALDTRVLVLHTTYCFLSSLIYNSYHVFLVKMTI